MKKYHDIVLDNSGNAVLSATITVSDVGGGASTIYSDNGITVTANPFTASSIDGAYSFYAANGRYDINIVATGFVTENLTDIVLFDKGDTYTDFESTGIDDNATSTAITINADESVDFDNDIHADNIIESYANIAALRAITAAPQITHATIKGYYADGDGGAIPGGYYWHTTSTDTDDGGWTIKAATITVGRFKAINAGDIPVLEQFGVSVGGNTTTNGNAINAAITAGSGSFASNLNGIVEFDVPVVITGSGRTININSDLTFSWTGATVATAWSFGDGVVSTRSIEVHNLKLNDNSSGAGVDVLLFLNKCVACQFYSLLLTSTGVRTSGVGLKTDFAFINDFYGLVIANLYDSYELGDDTNSTSFFGFNIEGAQNDGIHVPTGTNINRNNIYGGTIEGVVNDAVHLTSPSTGLSFSETYFEANGTDMRLDMTASETIPIKIADCRFKDTVSGASIVVSGPGRIISERCNNDGQALFDVTNASAWVKGTDNISKSSDLEFTATSVGNLVSSAVNGANIRYSPIRSMELEGIRIPVMQTGTVTSLTAGSSTTVTFTTAFLNTPYVSTSPDEHASVVSIVSLPSASAVTFRNRGSVTLTFRWGAFDIGDLN